MYIQKNCDFFITFLCMYIINVKGYMLKNNKEMKKKHFRYKLYFYKKNYTF